MPFVRRWVRDEVFTTSGSIPMEHITYVDPQAVRQDDEVLGADEVTAKQWAWLTRAHPEEAGNVAAPAPPAPAVAAAQARYAKLTQKDALAAINVEEDPALLWAWLEVELSRPAPRPPVLKAFSQRGIEP